MKWISVGILIVVLCACSDNDINEKDEVNVVNDEPTNEVVSDSINDGTEADLIFEKYIFEYNSRPETALNSFSSSLNENNLMNDVDYEYFIDKLDNTLVIFEDIRDIPGLDKYQESYFSLKDANDSLTVARVLFTRSKEEGTVGSWKLAVESFEKAMETYRNAALVFVSERNE